MARWYIKLRNVQLHDPVCMRPTDSSGSIPIYAPVLYFYRSGHVYGDAHSPLHSVNEDSEYRIHSWWLWLILSMGLLPVMSYWGVVIRKWKVFEQHLVTLVEYRLEDDLTCIVPQWTLTDWSPNEWVCVQCASGQGREWLKWQEITMNKKNQRIFYYVGMGHSCWWLAVSPQYSYL